MLDGVRGSSSVLQGAQSRWCLFNQVVFCGAARKFLNFFFSDFLDLECKSHFGHLKTRSVRSDVGVWGALARGGAGWGGFKKEREQLESETNSRNIRGHCMVHLIVVNYLIKEIKGKKSEQCHVSVNKSELLTQLKAFLDRRRRGQVGSSDSVRKRVREKS